ncbi:MAG: GntR family transcriptional regulator [Planctomycetota bacterium]
MTLTRTSLRQQAASELRERLLRGDLAPGQRVNETAVAAELGVSQTPVREALLLLERERFLDSAPGRGFSVRPLDPDEVREIYPVLGHLEAFALRSAGTPDEATLAELGRINAEMSACGADAARLHALDRAWHAALLDHVTNARLMELVDSLRANVTRYEHAFFRSEGRAVDSAHRHDDILVSLQSGDVDGAAAALERNWADSPVHVLAWLESRDA